MRSTNGAVNSSGPNSWVSSMNRRSGSIIVLSPGMLLDHAKVRNAPDLNIDVGGRDDNHPRLWVWFWARCRCRLAGPGPAYTQFFGGAVKRVQIGRRIDAGA